MTDDRNLDLGKLTHKQTTILALGMWRALKTTLAAHAEAVGTEAAVELRDRLIRNAKGLNTEGISLDDEATSLTALIASIGFSFRKV